MNLFVSLKGDIDNVLIVWGGHCYNWKFGGDIVNWVVVWGENMDFTKKKKKRKKEKERKIEKLIESQMGL